MLQARGASIRVGISCSTALAPRTDLRFGSHRDDLAEDVTAEHLSRPRQIQRDREAAPVFDQYFHSLRLLPALLRNAHVFADSDGQQFVLTRVCPKRDVQSRQDLNRGYLTVKIIWSGHHYPDAAVDSKHRSVREELAPLAHKHLRRAEQRLGQGLDVWLEFGKQIVHLSVDYCIRGGHANCVRSENCAPVRVI